MSPGALPAVTECEAEDHGHDPVSPGSAEETQLPHQVWLLVISLGRIQDFSELRVSHGRLILIYHEGGFKARISGKLFYTK